MQGQKKLPFMIGKVTVKRICFLLSFSFVLVFLRQRDKLKDLFQVLLQQ